VDLKLMPQGGAHPRQQFFHSKRLRNVIVGAQVKRLNLSGLVTTTGQDNNRDAFVARADRSEKIKSLHVR
jgi:hypothetical protein